MPDTPATNLNFNGVLDALQTNPGPRGGAAGLYLHVPFCFHKCHYCDFYSIVDQTGDSGTNTSTDPLVRENPAAPPARERGFADRLIDELRWWAERIDLQPRTIFAGGGTPTLLQPATWRRLLDELHQLGVLADVSEFTIEANPETVTPALMDVLVEGGVNRVSIGAQSFDTSLLSTLERWHDPTSVGQAVQIIRQAGIHNVSLDLIFAIPGQSIAQLDHDLDQALALEPAHLSVYSLIYEPNTAMTERLKQGKFEPIDESLERAMYERVIVRLAEADFEHYEISNWAKRQGDSNDSSSFRSEHNLLYWRNENWLGAGPSASSHMVGHRWKNLPHLGQYLASQGPSPSTDHEHLPPNDSVGEQLMMRLRLREGVPLDWLDQHVVPGSARDNAITELIHAALLERTATHLRLTGQGLMVADGVVARLL